jgi:hypothetical protein
MASAIRYEPADLIASAAKIEKWDERDWQHFHRIETEGMFETFKVKRIDGNHFGLIAYDSPYSSFEAVEFTEGTAKPVLDAYARLY